MLYKIRMNDLTAIPTGSSVAFPTIVFTSITMPEIEL